MEMKEELKTLLKEFDSPMSPAAASNTLYGTATHFPVSRQIIDSWKDELLVILDADGPLKDNKALWCRELMLTDKGREACGLPRAIVTPIKRQSKTLFD